MSLTPFYDRQGVTLYLGDCREILPQLDVKVDLVLTDPPYNVGLDYSDGDNRNDYQAWLKSWFILLPRPIVLTPGMVNIATWYAIEKPSWCMAWASLTNALHQELVGLTRGNHC